MTITTVQLALKDSADPAADEPKYDWEDHHLLFDTGATTPLRAGPADAAGKLTTIDGNAALKVAGAQRKGPHTWPIVYGFDALTAGPDGNGTLPLRERRRISAWTNGTSLVKMVKQGENFVADMTPEKTFDDGFDDGKTPRRYYQLADYLATGLPGLDDISVVSTIFFDQAGTGVDWARDFMQTTDPANAKTHADFAFVRARFLRQLIASCHASGLQVFAGFYVDGGNGNDVSKDHSKRMLDYFRNVADPLPIARAIQKFFDDRKLDIDGIWFDFEVSSLKDTDRPRVEAFVRAVAEELGTRGRYVAFASAPDVNGSMQPHFFSHPADLAQYPNIIVRPMTYDTRNTDTTICDSVKVNGAFRTPVSGMNRDAITRRHLGHYGLHPAQLQIAMGHCSNESGADIRAKLEALGTAMRPFRTGIIHWNLQNAADAATYAKVDANLNGAGGIPRGTFGQPIQGPLNRERIKVLADAGAKVTVPPDDVVG